MGRTSSLILVALATFVVAAAILLRFMPTPAADFDYLVAGSMATLAALLVMFLAMVSTRMKSGDVFFKKRVKKK